MEDFIGGKPREWRQTVRKLELEDLVAAQIESMERAYDTILGGNPKAAREILGEALGLN